MAEIQPFHGVLYNTARVNPADVLTQPYDKITPAMRDAYLARSPYNLVQIELGKEQPGDSETANKYTRARELYRQWQADGVLRKSEQPAFYYLEQSFASPVDPAQRHVRRGLVARVRLSPWDEGRVLPHEHTLSKPKADRISLLRSCGSQQGQIFMLYPTPPHPLTELVRDRLGDPSYEVVDDYQVTNRVWEITEPALIAAIQQSVGAQTFYIADGHHRYETAVAFRDECRAAHPEAGPDAPWEFVMTTLVDMGDPGLVVLPTHRLVANLPGFDLARFHEQLATTFAIDTQPDLPATLAAMEKTAHGIGMFDGRQFAVLRPLDLAGLKPLFDDKPPLWDQLDVAILHVAILEAHLGIDEQRLREEANVTYWREAAKACDQVRDGQAPLAFFLTPTPVPDVKAIADARSRMPQKSTDFFPKLLSGMVIYEVQ